MAFVVDASIALAWHFTDEASELAEALAKRAVKEQIVVPGHWWLEVANAVVIGERKRRAVPSQADELVARLAIMTIEVDDGAGSLVFSSVLPLARKHNLTIYDAIYLELAMRRGLLLATLDRDLATAARARDVRVIGVA